MSLVSAKVVGAGISYDDYSRQAPGVGRGHANYPLSRSALAEILLNPKRWRDGVDEDETTDALTWGSLIEVLSQAPEKFDELYAVAPLEYSDEKTGKMKPWNWNANVCKVWREDQGDKTVLKGELYEKASLAVRTLRADDDIWELFKCSKKQVMVVGEWLDKATGVTVPVRCLIDLVPDNAHSRFGKTLADFKTARNGNPNFWDRVVDDNDYDMQAALSLDLYTAATGEDRTNWLHPMQENIHPYHVTKPMVAMTVEFIAWGRNKYQGALARYARCLDSSKWDSFSTGSRLVHDRFQYVGPEALFKYRESGGAYTDHEPDRTVEKPASRVNDSTSITDDDFSP